LTRQQSYAKSYKVAHEEKLEKSTVEERELIQNLKDM